MNRTTLFLAGLVAAMLVTTGCGRVSPTQSGSLSTVAGTKSTAGKLPMGAVAGQPGSRADVSLLTAGPGSAHGRVLNSASQPLAGVSVVISPSNVRVTTNAQGIFTAPNLTAGNYEFKAMAPGLQQATPAGVLVDGNDATVPDIVMVAGNGLSGITSITYTQESSFGQLGEAPAKLVAPLGLAVRAGTTMVLDANKSPMVHTGIIRQYTESGTFQGKFGDYTKWLGLHIMRDTVVAIAVDNQGRALVLDGASKLWRFDTDGDKDKAINIDIADGNDIAVGPTGNIYIGHDGGITKLNAEGEGPQALAGATGCEAIAAGKDGLWAINGGKVQKLSAEGAMIQEFGASGTERADTFSQATDVAIDPRNGNVIVVDKGSKNVYVYDAVGTLIGKVGQGVFESPVSASVDNTGRVYVLDQTKKKVYRFVPTAVR